MCAGRQHRWGSTAAPATKVRQASPHGSRASRLQSGSLSSFLFPNPVPERARLHHFVRKIQDILLSIPVAP